MGFSEVSRCQSPQHPLQDHPCQRHALPHHLIHPRAGRVHVLLTCEPDGRHDRGRDHDGADVLLPRRALSSLVSALCMWPMQAF